MIVVQARNVNGALAQGVRLLLDHGVKRETRGGPVLVSPVPVTTVYERPMERVLFSAVRDANPFFHLVESLWMLAGRDDLATLTRYVKRMRDFSDDGGKTQPGAYGKRWRRHFWMNPEDGGVRMSRDQLSWAIGRLLEDTNDRRVVIQMYDADVDQDAADAGGKDVPCNLVACPWVDVEGRLSMTVFCRSNDIVWGAYGANAVHFAFLLEYLAAGVGVPPGRLYQVSNNYHAYEKTLAPLLEVPVSSLEDDRYDAYVLLSPPTSRRRVSARLIEPATLPIKALRELDEDLTIFFDEPAAVGLRTAFLRQVACPVVLAHKAYCGGGSDRHGHALEVLEQCRASDWRVACEEWIKRKAVVA